MTGFGTLTQSDIIVHDGEMFGAARPSGRQLALDDVELLAPTVPSKIVALWNNFHALAAKLNMPEPAEPLYLLKATTSVTAPGAVIQRPPPMTARPPMKANSASSSARPAARSPPTRPTISFSAIPASTTSPRNDILNRDPTFAQWARAKGFDDYGPFGPVVTSGIDPPELVVRTVLNGAERQNYPISDMIFSAQELVSKISHDMTLLPGDLICVRNFGRCRRHEGAGQHRHGRH